MLNWLRSITTRISFKKGKEEKSSDALIMTEGTMLRTCVSTVTIVEVGPRRLGLAHIRTNFTIPRVCAKTAISPSITVRERTQITHQLMALRNLKK
jgi:hypothetical protein